MDFVFLIDFMPIYGTTKWVDEMVKQTRLTTKKDASTRLSKSKSSCSEDTRKFVYTGLIEDSKGIKAHVNCFQHFGFFMTEDELIFNIEAHGTDKELMRAITELQDALDKGGISQ